MSRKQNSMKSALRAVAAAAVLGSASMGAMACGEMPYVGEVCTFAFNWCPRDFLAANGQELQIQQYTALFSLLGTQFGGNGQTTFKLPDLRGRAPIHYGQGPGLNPVNFAQASGAESVTITGNQLPIHNHALTGAQASGAVATTVTVNALTTETTGPVGAPAANTANTIGKIGAGSPAYYAYNAAKAVPVPVTASVNTNGAPAGTVTLPVAGNTANAGGSQPVSVLDPRLALNFCIATNGIYPSRP